MDSFLLMLSVALGALCTVLLLKIAFGEKREETDTAALEAAIRDALDRNSDAAEARQNRLEMRLTQANSLNREGMEAVRRESLDLIRKGSESQAARLTSMESSLAAGINAVNETVFQKLTALQAQNDAKLEQMRSTVEEKLQTTLQTRLSENFRLVATQLQALEEGLGEVKGLSENVDSLRRLMSNVKTRGTWGEAQLGAILSEILTPDQFGTNVETVPGTGKRVEFAVRMLRRQCGFRLTRSSRERTGSGLKRRVKRGTGTRNRPRRRLSGRAFSLSRKISRKSISRPRIRRNSGSCTCRPRVCTLRCFGFRASLTSCSRSGA